MNTSFWKAPGIILSIYFLFASLCGWAIFAHVALFDSISPWLFLFSVVILYLCSRPRYLLSPENLIFLYYFVWYGVSPIFSSRFESYTFSSDAEIKAYGMLYFTYAFSLGVLLSVRLFLSFDFPVLAGGGNRFFIRILLVFSFLAVIFFLYLFIAATGGINAWLLDSKMAFISRGGSGIYYLLYTHALIFFAAISSYYLYSRGGGWWGGLSVVAFVILMYPFIGSKLKVIMVCCLALAPFLVRSRVYSLTSVFCFLGGLSLVILGLYLRNYSWMTLENAFPYFLNYFNTLEMFVLLLNDFEAGSVMTAFLPANKVLHFLNGHVGVPYHDISLWLTSIYYPDAFKVGATEQWPIEADFYLSFMYWGGLPFLMVYLLWLSYLHQGARTGNLAFCTIYILEFFFIISHYRGGIFLWWYYYLIPFYIFVFFFFGRFFFWRREG